MPDDCDIRKPPAQWRVCELLEHSGIGFSEPDRQQLTGQLRNAGNGQPVSLTDDFSGIDELKIEGVDYRIDRREPRPQLVLADAEPSGRTPGTIRVHAEYHKCLTMLSRTMYLKLCKKMRRQGGSFRHFYHRVDHFSRLVGNAADMKLRHQVQANVVARQVEGATKVLSGCTEIPVTERHHLRPGRGAGRMQDQRDIVRLRL